MRKSLLNYAFELVESRNEPVSFGEIWEHCCKEAGLDEETAKTRVAQFYTNLTIDGRFVNLCDSLWNLRDRHTFDKVHIDMKDAYSDSEEDAAISGIIETNEDETEMYSDDEDKREDLEADE